MNVGEIDVTNEPNLYQLCLCELLFGCVCFITKSDCLLVNTDTHMRGGGHGMAANGEPQK